MFIEVLEKPFKKKGKGYIGKTLINLDNVISIRPYKNIDKSICCEIVLLNGNVIVTDIEEYDKLVIRAEENRREQAERNKHSLQLMDDQNRLNRNLCRCMSVLELQVFEKYHSHDYDKIKDEIVSQDKKR